jgi:hypothetical protein
MIERMCEFFQIFFVNFASSCARNAHVHRIRTLTLKISLLTVPNNFINEQDTSTKKFKASTNTLLQQSRD